MNWVIPCIPGDGIGAEIFPAAQRVLDAAVAAAYHGERQLTWLEVLAGEKAFDLTGEYLPDETLAAFKEHKIGLKGPLTTPVGEGHRSINVALRQVLDLYACVRPVRYYPGVPTPVKHPELLQVTLFRENTEDLYAGIEFTAGSEGQQAILSLLSDRFPADYSRLRFPQESAFSLKPVSAPGTQRLVDAAMHYAFDHQRQPVTLVHKGNIMKATEGGFVIWAYDFIEDTYLEAAYTQRQYNRTRKANGAAAAKAEKAEALEWHAVWVEDLIADAAFARALTDPASLKIIATTNLNGDYLSDALAAQVGGLGIAPGGNINYRTGAAIFEATHGTAPSIAGQGIANPTSLILSGAMLLDHIGWDQASILVDNAVAAAFARGLFTADLAPQGTPALSTTAFADALCGIISNL